MNFSEIKKDYLRLKKEYNLPEDMTGGFVDAEKLEKVMLNPTKANAAEYMKDVIQYGFQDGKFWNGEMGSKVSIYDDEFILAMYEKYVS